MATARDLWMKSVATGVPRRYCQCYGGLSCVPETITLGDGTRHVLPRCPGDNCATRNPLAPSLLVREDGGYEVTIPRWGCVGEVERWGEIVACGEDGPLSPPPDRKVEQYASELFAVSRRQRERRAGVHVGHPLAWKLRSIARTDRRGSTPTKFDREVRDIEQSMRDMLRKA